MSLEFHSNYKGKQDLAISIGKTVLSIHMRAGEPAAFRLRQDAEVTSARSTEFFRLPAEWGDAAEYEHADFLFRLRLALRQVIIP